MISIFKNEAFWLVLSGINVISFMICSVFNNPEGIIFAGLGFVSCVITIWANRAISSSK